MVGASRGFSGCLSECAQHGTFGVVVIQVHTIDKNTRPPFLTCNTETVTCKTVTVHCNTGTI
jgi:hypothetical protein